MGKSHSSLKPVRAVRAATASKIVTGVWSGGADYKNSQAQIIALASALPSAQSSFSPWTSTVNEAPTPQSLNMPGKVILSIGGSAAYPGGWSAMAAGGAPNVDNWVGYFKELFAQSGLQGLDFDLENINDPTKPGDTTVWEFIGQLSSQLKAAGFIITFTVFQSTNTDFPPAWFLTKYANACSYIVVMLYNGGMYLPDTHEDSWCSYATQTYKALPQALQSKFVYALYPKGGTNSCCAPCVQKAVDFINAGQGVGIFFWCSGGYLGSCTGGMSVVEEWVKILNSQGGATTANDFLSAFPSCTGPSVTDGCGSQVTPTQTYYSCGSSGCAANPSCTSATQAGCYPYSTCNNACGTPVQYYGCPVDGGTNCIPSTSATPYTNQTACNTACANPPMYSCSCGQCIQDPAGTYSSSNCDGKCNEPPALPCSSLGVGVPSTGGSCQVASQQFTCNGQTRCCCLGTVPSPSATNTTACVSGSGQRYNMYQYRY